MQQRNALWSTVAAVGAVFGYGFLIAFLYLVSMQIYHWFRDGVWTHIGMGDGLRLSLLRCCVKDADSGTLASSFLQWLDAPAQWLGLHQVVEVVPASLALFLVSMAGNCVFIYGRDRMTRPAS